MKVDIWEELQGPVSIWALNHIMPQVVEGGWTPESVRHIRQESVVWTEKIRSKKDSLTYQEGAYYGARAGAALSAFTFGSAIVPMTMTGFGIGVGLAYLID